MNISVDVDDDDLVALVAAELGGALAVGDQVDGPHRAAVLEIVLGSGAATIALAKAVVILVRGMTAGVVLTMDDNGPKIERSKAVPRGTVVVVRESGGPVEIVDLTRGSVSSAVQKVAENLGG